MSDHLALIIDDSRSARYALRKALEVQGYTVAATDSARAAYGWLEEHTPQVIFMDHLMPEIDGFSALQTLQANARTQAIPVVICSSNDEADFAAQARQRGAAAVLPKPPEAGQLHALLTRLATAATPPSVSAVQAVQAAAPADMQQRIEQLEARLHALQQQHAQDMAALRDECAQAFEQLKQRLIRALSA
ncbi:response regulator [Sinimarinibacterium sp. NLF-5-8]|uniref:response regulator n=1 Tax=Sinimarinibacterium sp. NLF-5-8 TaxID=2698684 RepID=UPI00137BC71E|nr:response regulator [Sinimarinibacterium sp. NLF-5-8]QHS11017.1 response regulator [Sinimarinibacterium sp. NLF-5-8]